METKIASYQEQGIRLQLIKVYNYDPNKPKEYIPRVPMYYYQIRKNRKVVCNLKWETPARQKFNSIIEQHLLQININYEIELLQT